jgi:HAMP domain-containing protein
VANISIKAKVSGVTIICLATFGVSLVLLFSSSYRKNVDALAKQSLANARSTFASLEGAEIGKMSAAAELVMANPEIRQTFANGEREKLIALTEPLFAGLRSRYGVTILNYIDADEKRFLTMTDTKDTRLIGTKAVRFNVQECARVKTWVTGLALGQLGFALRVTHPFYDTGTLKGEKLLGYIELGTEINGFMNDLKTQTGREYGMILRKQFLKEKDWQIQRERLKLPNNWADQKDTVLGANTWTDESIFSYRGDITTLPDEGTTLGVTDSGDSMFSRAAFPIKDASGAKVGAIFILVDVTSMYRDLQTTQYITIGATVGLIGLICAILLLMLGRLVFRRLDHITRIATHLVGGDYHTPVEVHSHDEIGLFETLFEQLRLIFVNLLEEYEKATSSKDKKQAS